MEKINFINNSVPAVNATNLNKMQDNAEDAINELQEEQNDKIKTTKTTSNTDTYSCNYINDFCEYSTSETKTNKVWIDNKPIYRKVIYIGQLPNNNTVSAASGLDPTGIRLTKIYGFATTSTGSYQAGLNDFNTRFILVANGDINVTVKEDYSGFYGTMVLEYTKTTD